jgi:hypothetical protein
MNSRIGPRTTRAGYVLEAEPMVTVRNRVATQTGAEL